MFVLIHSPLVSAFTWSRVAEEMRRRAIDVVVPPLHEAADSPLPLWQQHAEAVANALQETPPETRVILVAHSGAGLLLPVIGKFSPRPVDGYVFVDAGILFHDASHLDLRVAEDAERAAAFEGELRNGLRFPQWTSEDLSEEIPNGADREQVVVGLQPRGLEFFTEILPAFDFPNAPCAYLQFTEWYDLYARQAQERGWKYQKMEGGHFQILSEAVRVTDALLELTRRMREDAAK